MNKNIFFSRILFLSPHPDDIELGCGGLLSHLSRTDTDMNVIVFSSYFPEAPDIMKENEEALSVFKFNNKMILDIERRQFADYYNNITDMLVQCTKDLNINMIFCPSENDIHPDHKTIYQAVKRFWKKDLICYESPSSNDISDFNFFVELSQNDLDKKIEALGKYDSQIILNRRYFDPQYITALAITRGININKKYVEAYKIERMCL